MFGVIAHQIEGDPEQEGAGMGDPAVGEGRDADIGFLHDVGRIVRTDPSPEATVQPRSVAAVQAVQAAAVAMRHSSKTQASAAYDKGSSDRRVRAAMAAAMDYSRKFTAASSSKP